MNRSGALKGRLVFYGLKESLVIVKVIPLSRFASQEIIDVVI